MRFNQKDPSPLKPGNYLTDSFNRNPLFIVSSGFKSKKPLVVNNINEALALKKKLTFEDINPAFFASFILRQPTSNHSPYKKIKRVPRAFKLNLSLGGDIFLEPYDPFIKNKKKIFESDLHEFVKEKVTQNICKVLNLNKKNLIGVEHSTGIDSNCILGTLVKEINISPSLIYTYTNLNGEEKKLIDDFRNFYQLNKKQCISDLKDFNSEKSFDLVNKNQEIEMLKILGSPSQRFSLMNSIENLSKLPCKTVFSGLGGDQAISHNGLNIVFDLINKNRYIDFFKWSKNIYIFSKLLLKHKFIKNNYSRSLKHKIRKIEDNILIKYLKSEYYKLLAPFFEEQERWETNKHISFRESLKKRITSDWLSIRMEEETKYAEYKNLKMVYPLIDEYIVKVLLDQNPLLFCSSHNETRLIARNSFSDVLPPFLIKNSSKDRITNKETFNKQNSQIRIDSLMEEILRFDNQMLNCFNYKKMFSEVNNQLNEKYLNINYLIEVEFSLSTLLKLCLWGEELD